MSCPISLVRWSRCPQLWMDLQIQKCTPRGQLTLKGPNLLFTSGGKPEAVMKLPSGMEISSPQQFFSQGVQVMALTNPSHHLGPIESNFLPAKISGLPYFLEKNWFVGKSRGFRDLIILVLNFNLQLSYFYVPQLLNHVRYCTVVS